MEFAADGLKGMRIQPGFGSDSLVLILCGNTLNAPSFAAMLNELKARQSNEVNFTQVKISGHRESINSKRVDHPKERDNQIKTDIEKIPIGSEKSYSASRSKISMNCISQNI